ncbi:TolC family outer membrane protein [Methylovirgula sp. 4M-Z18]|uniref:TolC family outer membrane protein n=1 Tax=Methylovirgula sp. 4M-Z18 TaxID=2293567 RepID=UPI001FE0C7EB|nr:TolC family outer membrane protein [Methylovirgula sp. 4M-Z18]
MSAMGLAYVGNPDLNSQRANVRATDETIPKATSGYRPTITAAAKTGRTQYTQETPPTLFTSGGRLDNLTTPTSYGLSVTQNVWNGNRTDNSVSQAESEVLGAREQMRNTEQNVLLNAVTYYMNVLRDTAIYDLQQSNVQVLNEQLKQTKDRFQVGEVTRTDVAQAEAALAQGHSAALTAQSNLKTSIANYHQIVGIDPKKLEPGKPLAAKMLPKTLDQAIATSQAEHPSIQAAMHGIDSAQLNVKVVEGSLYPTVNLVGSVQRDLDPSPSDKGFRTVTASIIAQISVPIYDGGLTYASVRQAKETLEQQRLQTDLQRDTVRAAVVSAWGLYANSKLQIEAAQSQVTASEVALNGVREEAKVGQRTTLDVLNAQQTLINARVSLITAQRDQVVSSYALLSAVGRLSAATLALNVAKYDPQVHYNQVKDKWWGLRTPEGQ